MYSKSSYLDFSIYLSSRNKKFYCDVVGLDDSSGGFRGQTSNFGATGNTYQSSYGVSGKSKQ